MTLKARRSNWPQGYESANEEEDSSEGWLWSKMKAFFILIFAGAVVLAYIAIGTVVMIAAAWAFWRWVSAIIQWLPW